MDDDKERTTDDPVEKADDEDDAGASSALNIRTPWEEVMEMFRRASMKRGEEEDETQDEYVSCIKINDR